MGCRRAGTDDRARPRPREFWSAMEKQTLSIPVRGMTCASCVAHVEHALRSLEGVEDVTVNLATERASFR
ncbi:MAG: heavy-metal-associated domain-containing protein, partial [Thermoflexia bacterium]